MRGKFITFEGIDGAGKSTHLLWLTAYLEAQGKEVLCTREPGGTPLGEKLRVILLSESMQPETEALLMFAARAEHLKTVIEPALERGAWVVSDRFTDASFAYQCGGRGLAEEKLVTLECWVQDGLQPDLTLLFDVPLEISQQRLAQTGKSPDRFEQEKAEFFVRVRSAYLKRAAEAPNRIKVIDSSQSVAIVQSQLEGFFK
ncbi:MAG: dTMP kinase [Pseudomonadota bacterium]